MPKDHIQRKPLGDRDVMVGYQQWQGKNQAVIRYVYKGKQLDEWLPGKNGINIPEEDLLDAIQLLLDAYNEHTNTTLVIMDAGL